MLAQNAKKEIQTLFDMQAEYENETSVKEETTEEEEEEEQVLETYIESIEDDKMEDNDDEYMVHEIVEAGESAPPVDLIEIAYFDTEKLPKKYQSSKEKRKIMKIKSIQMKSDDDGLTVVQLDNNLKLFQCQICQRSFKEKSKLKSHLLIHTTERNIHCPVSIMFR
jgi:hypothetical protein